MDESLDREIESLVAAEPSPEFVARVRTRVAQEPEPGRWRSSWMFALAGTVAVVVVAAFIWTSRESAPSISGPIDVPRLAKGAETITPVPSPDLEPASRPAANATRRAVRVDGERRIDIDLPEVVVAENEVKTFASLVALIRDGRFETVVPAAPDLDQPLEIKELPAVDPIEIEPIVRLAVLQPEGERP